MKSGSLFCRLKLVSTKVNANTPKSDFSGFVLYLLKKMTQ